MRTPLLSLVIAVSVTLLYTVIMKIIGRKLTNFDAHYVLRVTPRVNSGEHNIGVDVDNVSKVLLTRITNLGYKGTFQTVNNNLLDIKVDKVSDTSGLTNLVTKNTILEFREVYTLKELGPIFVKADDLPHPVEAPVDTTTSNDSPAMIKYSDLDPPPPPKDNRPPLITTYITFSEVYNENDQLRFPSQIGYVATKDSTVLNKMLNDQKLLNALPKDTRFVYEVLKNFPKGKEGNYLGLYAVRTYPGQPAALDNDDIGQARLGYTTNGIVEIILSFKPAGAKKWFRLTSQNVGKPIAIIVDNFVITAPFVNAPIEGGDASISGAFTVGEAKEIISQLNAGRLTADVSIIKKEMTKHTPPLFPGNPVIYPVLFVITGGISYLLLFLFKPGINQPSIQS